MKKLVTKPPQSIRRLIRYTLGGLMILAIGLGYLAISRQVHFFDQTKMLSVNVRTNKSFQSLYDAAFKVKLIVGSVRTNQSRYYISGEVNSGKILIHPGQLTLRTAIAEAGGFTTFANRRKVQIQRDGNLQVVDMSNDGTDPSLDVVLSPSDIIVVPPQWGFSIPVTNFSPGKGVKPDN